MYKIKKDILQAGNIFKYFQIFSYPSSISCLKYSIDLMENFYSMGVFNIFNGNNFLQKCLNLFIKNLNTENNLITKVVLCGC